MPRYFVRCTDCLTVAAIDSPDRPAMNYGRLVARCGACDAESTIELMGQVERDRLVEKHLACACDERCTSARGPLCSCKCGGENHGAGLMAVIEVTTDKGKIPTLRCGSTMKARYHAEEYRRAIADALSVADRLNGAKKITGWLPACDYSRLNLVNRALANARGSRSQKCRMKMLEPYKQPRTVDATPEEARAILADLHALTSSDPAPIADVPFSLAAPKFTPSGWQNRLF